MKEAPTVGAKIGSYFRPQTPSRTDWADFFLLEAVERRALHETSTKKIASKGFQHLKSIGYMGPSAVLSRPGFFFAGFLPNPAKNQKSYLVHISNFWL